MRSSFRFTAGRRALGTAALLSVVALALPAGAAARTKVVYAGGTHQFTKSLGLAGINAFLVNRVTINVGDTVDWNGAALQDGFHTVDLPKLGGGDLSLVDILGTKVSGVKDAAGNPFWFNGKLPDLALNGALFAPQGGHAYDGSARIDSGLPVTPKPKDFKVTFTKAGVYKYYCDVHPGMVGFVVVKAKGVAVPSAAADAGRLAAAQAGYYQEAKRLSRTVVPARTVSLGASGPGGIEFYAMFPAKLTIKRGTTVTFVMSKDTRETHSATFGPAPYLRKLSRLFNGNAAPGAINAYPSDPKVVLTPTSHGNGFANTGLLARDPGLPLPPSNKITFAKAGTYHFICIVHPFMSGVVVVK